ncbi:hypothetical protein [Couchioplanes caeruleus]|uniref:hypothetical protein n=1 Tax=Couchioplanes caeruleus TaxID=56438 RepID=UPI00200F3E53|nr:hypothetical protein [Couchioplanes caeruleus]
MILWIITQLMIKIQPQRRGDEERYTNEGGNREHISPRERAPPARPRRGRRPRLDLRAICGYDGDRRGGYLGFEGDELRIQVFGGDPGIRRQNVPTGRVACRVNTRNRHSIGEPNGGW